MQRIGLERLVIVSGALLYPGRNPMAIFLRKRMADKLMDGRAAEDAVTASNLNWTVLRPPRLPERNDKKEYRIETGIRPNSTWSLQFQALAACLLDLSEEGSHFGEIVGMASL